MSAGEPNTLQGLRVLDFTRSIAGPWTARMLADAGAEVIKVEPPGGDFIRHLPAQIGEYDSGYFRQANAGKKSVAIDLQSVRGRELAFRLIQQCDVVLHNMRPNAARRLGLTAANVHAVNPTAVFCSISGYGSDSQYVDKPGQDLAIQCMTGIAVLTGEQDGAPAVPVWSLVDTLTSAYAYLAICSALLRRKREPDAAIAIEVTMSQCCAALHDIAPHAGSLPGYSNAPLRAGRYHPYLVVRGVVPVRDGYISVSAFRRRDWSRLAALLGEPFTASAYHTQSVRLQDKAGIEQRLDDYFADRSADDALHELHSLGIPAEKVQESFDDVADLGIFQERGMLISGEEGLALVSGMIHREAAAAHMRSGSPGLGDATSEVMNGLLRLPQEEMLDLMTEDVVCCEPSVMAGVYELIGDWGSSESVA